MDGTWIQIIFCFLLGCGIVIGVHLFVSGLENRFKILEKYIDAKYDKCLAEILKVLEEEQEFRKKYLEYKRSLSDEVITKAKEE